MFAAALVSEIASAALVPATWRGQLGLVVPIPTFDAVEKYKVDVAICVPAELNVVE